MSDKQKGITPDRKKSGKLVSRLPHPVTLSYNGETIIVPPRAAGKTALRIDDRNLLGALPKGVALVD